jgi:aminoglycoside phosphotransferase (APT) family kinase protein
VVGVSAERLRFVRGRQADVVIDDGAGLVYRFARHPLAAAELPRRAELLREVARLRLPVAVPEVVAEAAGEPLGRCHLVTRLLLGEPLWREDSEALDPEAAERLASGLAALLTALAAVDPSPALRRLLGPPLDAAWWAGVERRATDALLHLLPPETRARAAQELRAAVEAAHGAPHRLAHGDLSGRNVLIDPATGRLTGVLDWDSLAMGDPALDLAALSTGLSHRVLERLFLVAPDLRGSVRRAHAYAATFELQKALQGFEDGDLEAVANGLDGYR